MRDNWYKRAQEESEYEDLMGGALKEGIEAYDREPMISAVEAEVSQYGVTMDKEDREWVIGKLGSVVAVPSLPFPNSAKAMAMSIVFSKWSLWGKEDIWKGDAFDQKTLNGAALAVFSILAKGGVIHDSNSFLVAKGIYESAIAPLEGQYTPETVAELLTVEMGLKK